MGGRYAFIAVTMSGFIAVTMSGFTAVMMFACSVDDILSASM
jgi:hypothetical protein